MLDFHNHLMPGVDDGAADLRESRGALEALSAAGVSEIITTPHLNASLAKRGELDHYLEIVERGWTALSHLATAEFPWLRVERGFEIMLDLPHPVLDDPRFHLAGTQFVLVEFPYMNIPPNSSFALRELRQAGLKPIVAHPERYTNMDEKRGIVEEWKDAGAYLQVNAGSFIGTYGSRAKSLAWSFLEEGEMDYISSDYHSRGKCNLAAAIKTLNDAGFDEQVEALKSNGRGILEGRTPDQLAPMKSRTHTGWRKVLPWI